MRWIGAAKRRAERSIEVADKALDTAEIIRLSCADTFFRPVRTAAFGESARVLPFEARAIGGDLRDVPLCAVDQPPVPVLR